MRLVVLTSREIKISGSTSINTYDDRGKGGCGGATYNEEHAA